MCVGGGGGVFSSRLNTYSMNDKYMKKEIERKLIK